MRRIQRLFLAIAFLAVASCSNPFGPKYPQPDDETQPPDDTKKGGFVIMDNASFWV